MENNNSVCFVAKINEITPIENADNLELAKIGGWNCIVKKNSLKVDDLVVCATTDAIIPQKISDELNITNYLRKGQRVRTIKLRGVYSECLLFPITFVPEKYQYEGCDCMDVMGIKKFEPQPKLISLGGYKRIPYYENPYFHIYYKFPNLKNVPHMFSENDEVEITRKIHGTNARYGIVKKHRLSFWDKIKKFIGVADKWIDYEFVVGSHNMEKGSDSQGYYERNVWFDTEKKYDIKNKLWNVFNNGHETLGIKDSIIIYGEIYGLGIQKGYDYGLNEIQYVGFDVAINNEYVKTSLSSFIHEILLSLPYVEVLYVGNWSQSIQDRFVFNNYINDTKIPHEGIVIKCKSGNRGKVAKVINPDYLIYSEKNNVSDSH